MKKKIICFYPSNQKRTNHFLYNLSRLVESSGFFECVGYKEVKKKSPGKIFFADIYHLNWFDQSRDLASFFKRMFFLFALRLKKKKIVWTIHNIESHIATPSYNKLLFYFLARFSTIIHTMNLETVKIANLERFRNKIRMIPHGDYYDSYPDSDFDVRGHYGIEKSRRIFLFLGAIQPYKNVDVLIDAFGKTFEAESSPVLLVCGRVEPDYYLESIRRKLEGISSIVLDPRFIADGEMSAYVRSADILVAPYGFRSSLNSGTIPLAFSYGKTLICSDIPCVKDIQSEMDCLYHYHYSSRAEHVQVLSEKLSKAYFDILDGSIREKEKNAVLYMKKNSWKAHQREWIQLYGASV